MKWKAICLAALSVVSLAAAGETADYKTQIVQTATQEESRGGCWAKLAQAPSTKGLVCGDAWVHFSCNGTINSQTEGYAKLSAAQLALISGTSVKIWVTDDTAKKIAGKCYATRIDNFAK